MGRKKSMTDEQFRVFRTEMRKLRKRNGLTIAELAELIGASAVHIGTVERGASTVSADLAERIAEAFGMTADEMCVPEEERHMAELEAIGKELRDHRYSRNFGINEVAGFIGVSREIYLEMEAGKCNVADSIKEKLDRLYATAEKVETVEVIKEVPTDSPITLETIEKVLPHIAEMNIDKEEQRALFRTLSEARVSMLEAQLFG